MVAGLEAEAVAKARKCERLPEKCDEGGAFFSRRGGYAGKSQRKLRFGVVAKSLPSDSNSHSEFESLRINP